MAGHFDQFKFLSTEERTLMEASVADNDTHDDLIDRLQDHEQEGDRTMGYTPPRPSRVPRGAHDGYDADNPHDDYQRLGQGTQRKLDTAAVDYADTVQVIDSSLAKAEEAFSTAFERADVKAAIRRRIDGTANTKTLAEAERRRNKIG